MKATYRNTSDEWGDSTGGLTLADYEKQAEIFASEGQEHIPTLTADDIHIYADGVPVADRERMWHYTREKANMTTQANEKWTPGPWAIDSTLAPNSRSVIARTVCGLPISGNTSGPHDIERDYDNARLIAAAPDLYAALDWAVKELAKNGTSCAEWRNAKTVLARARGEA